MKEKWQILLDQNVRVEVKVELLNLGIDTVHASDVQLQKALDPEILQYAIEHDRTLVTRDTDFGDLKFFRLPNHHPGVIRVQINPPLPSLILQLLLPFIEKHVPKDVLDALVIITKNKIRIRR